MITPNSARRSRPTSLSHPHFTSRHFGVVRRRSPGSAGVRVSSSTPGAGPTHRQAPAGFKVGQLPLWKRTFDLSIVAATLALSIPLAVLVVFWIRLVSKGPALFRQERIGIGGRPFTLYKFRTMFHGASTADHEQHMERLVELDQPLVKLDLLGDRRLIPGGCFLRTSGLDELPQLLNVFLGEMSLVGPRPCLPGEYALFGVSQAVRFSVLPGLTGLWQVKGKNSATFKEMNAMDADYASRASLLFDVMIILRTPMALLSQMRECLARHRARRVVASKDALLGYATQRLGDRS